MLARFQQLKSYVATRSQTRREQAPMEAPDTTPVPPDAAGDGERSNVRDPGNQEATCGTQATNSLDNQNPRRLELSPFPQLKSPLQLQWSPPLTLLTPLSTVNLGSSLTTTQPSRSLVWNFPLEWLGSPRMSVVCADSSQGPLMRPSRRHSKPLLATALAEQRGPSFTWPDLIA